MLRFICFSCYFLSSQKVTQKDRRRELVPSRSKKNFSYKLVSKVLLDFPQTARRLIRNFLFNALRPLNQDCINLWVFAKSIQWARSVKKEFLIAHVLFEQSKEAEIDNVLGEYTFDRFFTARVHVGKAFLHTFDASKVWRKKEISADLQWYVRISLTALPHMR